MSEALPEVDLARHGETAWTVSGQHTGRTDLPLTDRGERNAANLCERLRGMTFSRVLVSPLGRARHTARTASVLGRVELRIRYTAGDLDRRRRTLDGRRDERGREPSGRRAADRRCDRTGPARALDRARCRRGGHPACGCAPDRARRSAPVRGRHTRAGLRRSTCPAGDRRETSCSTGGRRGGASSPGINSG